MREYSWLQLNVQISSFQTFKHLDLATFWCSSKVLYKWKRWIGRLLIQVYSGCYDTEYPVIRTHRASAQTDTGDLCRGIMLWFHESDLKRRTNITAPLSVEFTVIRVQPVKQSLAFSSHQSHELGALSSLELISMLDRHHFVFAMLLTASFVEAGASPTETASSSSSQMMVLRLGIWGFFFFLAGIF